MSAERAYYCFGERATIVGTDRPDRLDGTDGPEVIVGRRGKDYISGKGGNDLICGGPGGRDTGSGAHREGLGGGGEAKRDETAARHGPDGEERCLLRSPGFCSGVRNSSRVGFSHA